MATSVAMLIASRAPRTNVFNNVLYLTCTAERFIAFGFLAQEAPLDSRKIRRQNQVYFVKGAARRACRAEQQCRQAGY